MAALGAGGGGAQLAAEVLGAGGGGAQQGRDSWERKGRVRIDPKTMVVLHEKIEKKISKRFIGFADQAAQGPSA